MEIKFNIEDFQGDKNWLLKILSSLRRRNRFNRTKESDIFFATSPAIAYKYVENLISEYEYSRDGRVYKNTHLNKLDPNLEKVFLKNIKYALKYLIATEQKEFSDIKLNKRFLNKIFDNAFYSFVYAKKILHGRIPVEKENIFLSDYNSLYQYAKQIIKGRYESNLHNQIVMLSFSDEAKIKRDYSYIESYLKYIDNPRDQTHVSSYYGRYF